MQFFRHRTWEWQAVIAGLLLLVADYLISMVTHSLPADASFRVVGIGLAFAGLLGGVRSKIMQMSPLAAMRFADSDSRSLLMSAWWAAVAGASLFLVGAIVAAVTGNRSIGLPISLVGGFVLVIAPALIISYIGPAISFYRSNGAVRSVLLTLLIIISAPLFSAIVLYLVSNGDDIILLPQAPGWVGACEDLLIALVISALIAVPHQLCTILPWDGAAEVTKRLLPSSLGGIAAIATGMYALLLHLSRGPLSGVKLPALAAVTFSVMVLLTPPYRSIAMACWRWGLWDVIFLGHWRAEHSEMIRQIRAAIIQGWAEQRMMEERQARKTKVPEIQENNIDAKHFLS